MRFRLLLIAVFALALPPPPAAADILLDEKPQSLPLDEFSSVPEGLLAPPPSEAKPVEVVKKKDELPQALGQIPGVFEIPGAETAHPEDEGSLSFEQVLLYYKQGKYPTVLKNLVPMADAKQHDAEELLGVMCLGGQGLDKDVNRAFALLTRAAEGGRPLAQHYLATLYFSGAGVSEVDDIRALMWLHIAILHYPDGPEKVRARQDRDRIYLKMSRLEKNRAVQMAREWLDKHGEGHLMDMAE